MGGKKRIAVEFRIWFFCAGEKLLGKGRVELLERIQRTGSILNAAKEMKMSYRQAWQMVQEINARAPLPYVEKKMGGRGVGGAIITTDGSEAIARFHNLHNKVEEFIQAQLKEL